MCISKELLILLDGAAGLAPPEPGTAHLVPRAEYHRHLLSVSSLERIDKLGNSIKPRVKLGVELSARQYLAYGIAAEVPCVLACGRVVGMPA